MNERIKWIDVVKCFGIFGIYVLHFGEQAGRSYPFFLVHFVAMFFVAAGCMENYNHETNFIKYLVKKIKTMMVPFWVFGAIAAVVTFIYCNYDSNYVGGMILELGLGVIRNTFPAASLWFLTCLFVMQVMFFFIKKITFKPLIVAIGIALYLFSVYGLNPSPMFYPNVPYNVDSAMYYMIYYIVGYCAFPYLVKLFALDTKAKKIGFGVAGFIGVIYSMYTFLGIDAFSYVKISGALVVLLPILSSCAVSWTFFVIARLVEDVEILSEIGKNSLYLCGCEYVVKTLAICFFGILGYSLVLPNPLSVYVYSAILLVLANKYFVPVEKYIIKKLVK